MTLNINKKKGDLLTHEEINLIGQTIDKNTEAILLQEQQFNEKIEELMLSNSDCLAAAWDYNSESEIAVKQYRHTAAIDWKMFLIDHSDNANQWSTPVGILMRNNLLRFEDGSFAPVVGITLAQKAECDIELYRKVAGQLVKYCDAGSFNPTIFYNEFGITEPLFNSQGKAVRVLRPWETTETKYSIYLGCENKLYLIHNVHGTNNRLWNAIFTHSHSWDGITPIELLPTGITPSGVYCIEENGINKTRCFFNLYAGLDQGSVHSAGSEGKGGLITMFKNNRTYPTTSGIHQMRNMEWARNNNANPKSSLPVAEGGFPYRDLFITSLEIMYGRKDLHNERFFGSGISSNASISDELAWKEHGGVRYKIGGAGNWKYATFASTPSDICYDAKGNKADWSSLLNGYFPKEQCMESQIAASWASEIRKKEGEPFEMYDGTYWWKNVVGAPGLLDGRMNVRIFKLMKQNVDMFSSSGAKINVDIEVILRMSLFEGCKLAGDIYNYWGGGYEAVGETLPTSKGGSTGEPVDLFLQPDQSKWHSETSSSKPNKGVFDFEKEYIKLGKAKTMTGYVKRSLPFSNWPLQLGGGLTRGECCYFYNSNWWGYTTPGTRVRIGQRFSGYANNSYCAPRYADCHHEVGHTNAYYGGSAQVRLKHEPARFTPQE